VHVDWMWQFYSNLTKDGVQGPWCISTMPDNLPQPTGADKLTSVGVAKSDKPTSQGTSVAELLCSPTV